MAIAFDEDCGTRPDSVKLDGMAKSGTSIVFAILLVLGLAGCAAQPSGSTSEDTVYVGVFTGEYVDGIPLYRFPSITVVGARSSVGID
jgi:hypothetical protein